ncbi:MAG TPA: aldo/keto reductase [Paracoccaceae bacterium]|nr:aldo/keto reductase [Paracoccaceae bacterium]
MHYRNLGRSGLRVSVLGLGCNYFGWRIGLEEARAVVHRALDGGITLFVTADIYGGSGGSETQLGEILGAQRKEIVLATKVGMAMDPEGRRKGGSRRHIMASVEESLRRLKTDWIDLYQLHQPDPLTPIDETLRAFDDLVRQGKVRYVGCSNLPAWEVARSRHVAEKLGLEHFVSAQDEYSLVVRGAGKELLPALEAYGMGLLPYFPLASGLLTGKYRRGGEMPGDSRFQNVGRLANRYLTEGNWDLVERLSAFAEERGHSLVELAFGWLLAHPVVASVPAGATRPDQVEANIRAAEWLPSAEDMQAIGQIIGGA